MALLKRGSLEKIDTRDGWALGDDHRNGPLYGEDVRRVARLDDLLPLGYGDKLVPVSDERFALVDAQQVQPGDIYLDYRQEATPQGLARVPEDTKGLWGELVLVAHIRRMR